MLGDLHESMRAMIAAALGERAVTVAFEPPPPSRPGKPSGPPIVDLWLADIREDKAGRHADWFAVRDDDGVVASWHPPIRHYRLTYLTSVWAANHAKELEILGDLLRSLGAIDSLPAQCRQGWLAERTENVRVVVANPEQSMADNLSAWSALGVPARSSITLAVTVPVHGEPKQPAEPVKSRRISVESSPTQPLVSEVISEVLEPAHRDDALGRRRRAAVTEALPN